MKSIPRLISAGGAFLAVVLSALMAQATTLGGVVTDENKHPLAYVFVTAKNIQKKMSVSVLTDAKGKYQICGLFPARYVLRAERIGYERADVKDFNLTELDARKDFGMSAKADISDQMPPYAWLASLPEPDTFPYSLRVDGVTGAVWITGNGADSLYRFDPERKTFTTYRLPGQVVYGRMVSIDYSTGDVWTSLSNLPNKHTCEPKHGDLVRLQFPRP